VRQRAISVLDRKLLRDFWRLRGQILAIALVIAGGVAIHVIMAGMLASLQETRAAYYERTRFADIWAPAVRAPNALMDALRSIDGVAAAETRIAAPVLFDMPGMSEPPAGLIYSLPGSGERPLVNDLHVVRGALPRGASRNEAVVLESFARAHDLDVGDLIEVTIRGRREQLTVSGLVLSPEWVYAIAPGQIVPDPALFGVVWMDRRDLETASDLKGAFNETVLRLTRGAEPASVIAGIDRLLAPYGGTGAFERRDQVSDAFLSSELEQLQTMGAVMPPVFLLVAAFLVNIVVSRLVAVERAQIGLLKAFGYSSLEVTAHYIKFALLIAVPGLVAGFTSGAWLGRALAQLYTEYFSFPFLIFAATPGVYATGALVTVAAVGGGAFLSVRHVARLEPAMAMRAPPPPDYSRGLGAGLSSLKAIDPQSRMILRQLFRWPVRAGLTVLGVSASGALLLTALYFNDSVKVMIESYFDRSNRYDIAVSFTEARSMRAFHDLSRRAGALEAEPFRAVDARLSAGHREVRTALIGLGTDPQLSRMMTASGVAAPPPGGLVLSADLASRLGVQAGDVIRAAVTSGRRPVLELPVAATPEVLVGSGAHMRLGDLNAALGEGSVISGVFLRVDRAAQDALYLELKEAPLVAGVQLHRKGQETFSEMLDESMGSAILIYIAFAGLITLGVIYNSVRVSMAERERELATLQVLGFSKGEVSYILLGEAALLTLLSIAPGLAMGAGLAWAMSEAMSSDFFRLPFVLSPSSLGLTCLVLIVIAALSGLVVRRRIDRFDLVAVLKSS